MNKLIVTTAALSLCIAWSASADPVTLELAPAAGSLAGNPGSTIGWGFSLTNATSDFLVVANSFFCEGGQTPASSTCSPRLGVYSDIVAGNATVVDPGSMVTQAFDAHGSSGLGSYTIWSSAAKGQIDSGSISVVYDLFNADPFTQSATQIGGDQIVSTVAQVSVGTSVTSVPEPALPLLSGLIGLGVLTIRRRLSSRLKGHN